MKTISRRKTDRAFNLIEVLIVVFGIMVLAAFFLHPGHPKKQKAEGVICMSNLKQLDLAFNIWTANTNRLPWEVSTSEGGTRELIGSGNAFPHFQTISNYGIDPRVMVCPSDKSRKPATNFARLTDTNLSYFVNLDTDLTHPSISIIAGDRHLQTNGFPVKPGLVCLTTSMNIGWTRELHSSNPGPVGMLAFADGHVESAKKDLSHAFSSHGVATNRFAVP